MNISRNTFAEKILFCPEAKVQRSAQIWHTIFSVMNALQSTLLLFLVTRLCGSEKAGVFSLAFSVSYLMIMIGNYGVRNYQATDVNFLFGFREYRYHRRATCVLMMLASIAYVWLHGYAPEKAQVVLLCCMLKMIESIENVYHAEYQRANRLDVASKIGSFRITLTILAFVIALILSDNLILSFFCMDVTALVVLVCSLVYTYPRVPIARAKEPTDWKRLFIICLPLFLCTFFYMYICNASKYALDRYATEEIQGCYGMIFTPVFAINLVSNCIYGPFLVRLAEYWRQNQVVSLKRFVKVQTLGVLIIGILASAAGYLLGTQVLSLVFGLDLSQFRLPLTILLAGSGMTALVDFTSNILTVIRKQKILVYIYGSFAALSFVCTGIFVRQYGIDGAAYAYAIVMTAQAAVTMAFVMALLKRGNPCA